MLEADQTSGTSSPHGSLACLSSQVSRRGVLLVSHPFGQQEERPAGSSALRIRARITRPGSASRTRDHASARPHPVPLPIKLMYLLLPASVQWLHSGSGCRPTARTKFSACMESSCTTTWFVKEHNIGGSDHACERLQP